MLSKVKELGKDLVDMLQHLMSSMVVISQESLHNMAQPLGEIDHTEEQAQ